MSSQDPVDAATFRRKRASAIAEAARASGLDVSTERVLSRGNMRWFERWYYGGLSTGYLIRRLGLKPLPKVRREFKRWERPE